MNIEKALYKALREAQKENHWSDREVTGQASLWLTGRGLNGFIEYLEELEDIETVAEMLTEEEDE